MKTFYNFYNSLLSESPDAIEIKSFGKKPFVLDADTKEAITFTIIADVAIYSKRPRDIHSFMNQMVLDVTKKYDGDTKKIVEELAKQQIYVINAQDNLFNYKFLKNLLKIFQRNREIAQEQNPNLVTPGVIAGRFYGVGSGYISFWEPRRHIMKQMATVVQMIKEFGFDPIGVKWEIYDPEYGEELVSYEDYISKSKRLSKEERAEQEALRKRQIARHIIPGMKKLEGVI